MALSHSPSIITSGLVLCLDAANTKSYPGSGTTWTDLSSNGNTGTLVNGVGYNSSNLGSLVFDGVDDYINMGSNANFSFGTENFTIECWYRRNGSQQPRASFLCTGTESIPGATTNWQLGFGSSTIFPESLNTLVFSIGAQLGGLILSDTIISPDLQWIYACVTRSETLVSLYKNGSLISSGTNSFNLSDQTLRFGINRNSTRYLSGNISNIRLYKGKSLTVSEIQQNYNALKGRFGLT